MNCFILINRDFSPFNFICFSFHISSTYLISLSHIFVPIYSGTISGLNAYHVVNILLCSNPNFHFTKLYFFRVIHVSKDFKIVKSFGSWFFKSFISSLTETKLIDLSLFITFYIFIHHFFHHLPLNQYGQFLFFNSFLLFLIFSLFIKLLFV